MFKERLKELREGKGLSQKALANILSVSQGTIGNWESGIREPNFDMVQKLADYFQVTTDYLLGLSSRKTLEEELDEVEFALRDGAKRLTRRKKEALLSYLRFLEQEEEKER